MKFSSVTAVQELWYRLFAKLPWVRRHNKVLEWAEEKVRNSREEREHQVATITSAQVKAFTREDAT